jgi:hypothetical protein
MGWIDNIVVGIIVIGGLFILYKALKEPVDLVLGFIGKGLVSLKDTIVGAAPETGTVISYG